jgi:hypothetical protein
MTVGIIRADNTPKIANISLIAAKRNHFLRIFFGLLQLSHKE